MNSKAIWVTWERQVRNASLSSRLGVPLHVIESSRGRLSRYASCCARTMGLLIRHRPRVVFCQNPSIVLNYLLLLLRPLFGFTVVSDCHFAGVVACNGSPLFQKLLDLCNRSVDLAIVTNPAHAAYIEGVGGRAAVCPDPLPLLSLVPSPGPLGRTVLFICSYDVDEPFRQVFEAAAQLYGEGFRIMATGNYAKGGVDPARYPSVTFTGYLPVGAYHELLLKSAVIVDLTENENCLVCGAYEAMAAEVPLVTSDTACLRGYFTAGTLFTTHDPAGIARAVRTAFAEAESLRREIRAWKPRAEAGLAESVAAIRSKVGMPENEDRKGS